MSQSNDYLVIKYKFVKFNKNSGIDLLVSKNIKYFAECAYFSTELLPSQISNLTNKENVKWLILHELGHVPFLLEHLSEYSADIQKSFDNSLSSVMSYNHIKNSFGQNIYPVTPSHFDISLVQKKFGINKFSTNNDDYYKFSLETYGHHTIYDSGGIDTIDLSNFYHNLHITLNSGPNNINYVSSTFSFSIYESSVIENIFTGSGNDIIYGNNANNKINPGSGINTIYGGGGSNLFIFNKENHSKNIIKDFDLKKDKIVLEGFYLSCHNFMQIVTKSDYQTLINPATHVSIELQGNYLSLNCDNFIFS